MMLGRGPNIMLKSVLQLLSVVFVWIGSASAQDQFSESTFREKIEICEGRGIQRIGDVFCFTGSIPLKASFNQWPDLLSSKIIVINSPGGEVEAAMKIARHLSRNDVLTIIHGSCSSSCVNYILPAASKLFLEKNTNIYGLHWPILPEMSSTEFRYLCEHWMIKFGDKIQYELDECIEGKYHQKRIQEEFFEEFPNAVFLWAEFYALAEKSIFPAHTKPKCRYQNCSYHLHVNERYLNIVNPNAKYFDLSRTNPYSRCLASGVFYKMVGQHCYHPIN